LSVRRDGAAATKVVRPLESRVETAAQASTGFADFVRPRKDHRGVDLISDCPSTRSAVVRHTG